MKFPCSDRPSELNLSDETAKFESGSASLTNRIQLPMIFNGSLLQTSLYRKEEGKNSIIISLFQLFSIFQLFQQDISNSSYNSRWYERDFSNKLSDTQKEIQLSGIRLRNRVDLTVIQVKWMNRNMQLSVKYLSMKSEPYAM